jgi:hypothetical protein
MPIVLVARMSASNSLVLEGESLDTSSSVQARDLAIRLRDKVLSTSDLEEFTANQDEINGLIQLAMRGIPRLAGRVNVTPWRLVGAFSLHVPENPFGEYLNFRADVLPSSEGLEFAQASIGRVQFSNSMALTLFRFLLDFVLADQQGSMFVNAIESVVMNGQEVSVKFRPIPDLRKRLEASKERIKTVRDDLALLGDPAVVRLYYQKLCELDELHVGELPASMAWYTAPVFDLAKRRVQIGSNVALENRAALLALGIFMGSAYVETLVGSVRTGKLENCKPTPRYIVLANRHDLRLHFMVSAVIKVISDSGMSSAVGEFKELLDAEEGGSGFSFADLAADMAGVKFAEQLLDDSGEGMRTLIALADTYDENVFFPSIAGLQEGLSKQQFEIEYGNLQDPRYQSVVTEIEYRLASLPLYTN